MLHLHFWSVSRILSIFKFQDVLLAIYLMRTDKKLELTTLEHRRHRGDLIQCCKIIHGLDKVNWCLENKIQGK